MTAELYRATLAKLSARAKVPFQGFNQAVHLFRGRLTRTGKKLRYLSSPFAVGRHISGQSSTDLLHDLDLGLRVEGLGGVAAGSKKYQQEKRRRPRAS